MSNDSIEKELHVSRYIILYKLILGISEVFLGLGVLLFRKYIIVLYENFKAKELLEDPHDLLINIIERTTPFILKHQGYIVLLLLVLGVVKIIGSIGLMYHKHWGLDMLVVLTILLLPFQLFNLVISFSISKLLYLAINIFISLYLVKFQPQSYFKNLNHRVRKRKI